MQLYPWSPDLVWPGHGLPPCPGYGHWVSCFCVVLLFGFGFRGSPATPGWGLGCVCLGTGFGFAPPFLAGVYGLCGWARVLACTRPFLAGVLACVWLCARSACTPPFQAQVCVVGVCAWAWLLAAPRHSWLGCWGVCVFVCALRLYPATPGGGVRCGCVCLGSGFGCAPPLLARVLRCVCVCVRAPHVPRHSWLGCAAWVCVLWLGFWLRSATPGWGVGLCVCLCARSACTPPLVPGACGVGVCAWAWVLAAPRHSSLGCWHVCVFVCALLRYPATPGWGVRHGCVCIGSGFGCAPPLLAGVLRCVCVCVHAPHVPRHSCLGRVVWVCVLGLGFWLCTATPRWGVGMCVCLCARSSGTPPLRAGVCGVGVCAWARVSAAPRHSWPVCRGVCVFVCALLRYPAIPGWHVRCGCVCLGSGFSCAPPLLAGVLGLFSVCVRTPLVARHSWLVVRCGCVCLGSGFGCVPPLLAGVFGCACVCVRAPLVPRYCWLGCAALVCVLGLGIWLRPATPGVQSQESILEGKGYFELTLA